MKLLIYTLSFIGSGILVHLTGITQESFFDINNQITYLGILIGFALTLYTFGLSVLKDIYEIIEAINFKKIENKQSIFQELKNTFNEMKSDIIVIFSCIVSLFVNSILKTTSNPIGLNVEFLRIPEIISISVFILSTLSLLDIMKALFNLSNLIFKK